MSTKESLNQLVKNITGEDVKTERITESLTELVKALDAGGYLKPTDDTISELVDVLAEVLPDKIGIAPTGTIEITENGTDIDIAQYATADVNVEGITVAEFYDIPETTLNGATYEIVSGVVANIPDGVVAVGNKAFMGNTTITKVIMSDSVTTIEDGVYQFPGAPDNAMAFGECANLKVVVFSNNLTSVGNYAFYGCTSLTSITIPDSVTSIGGDAFSGCTSLTSITIPDSVTSISSGAFSGCTSLTSITIPDSVTSIGTNAFLGCTGLTSITIPDSVTSISESAFYECTSLTSITIPDSVTSIGTNAFLGCESLTDIYYTGTQAEWVSITGIGSAEIPKGATIHYEYTPS